MSVYKSKGGFYRIQFMLNGKNYVKSSKTSNKKAAEQMEANWRAEIHGRRYLGAKEEIKVRTLIDNYMARPLAETTLRCARSFFGIFKKDVDTNINASEFNQAQILKHVQKRLATGMTEGSIRTQLLYFCGAWNDGNKDIYNIPDMTIPKLRKSSSAIRLHERRRRTQAVYVPT